MEPRFPCPCVRRPRMTHHTSLCITFFPFFLCSPWHHHHVPVRLRLLQNPPACDHMAKLPTPRKVTSHIVPPPNKPQLHNSHDPPLSTTRDSPASRITATRTSDHTILWGDTKETIPRGRVTCRGSQTWITKGSEPHQAKPSQAKPTTSHQSHTIYRAVEQRATRLHSNPYSKR